MILCKSKINWTAATAQRRFDSIKNQLSVSDEGKTLKFVVTHGGNVVAAMRADGKQAKSNDGTPLYKRIYSIDAVNVNNTARYANLVAQAKASDNASVASDLYNEFLNRTEVSFNVLSGSRLYNQSLVGRQIEARVMVVRTEKGNLVTLDPKSICVIEAGTAARNTMGASIFGSADMVTEKAETTPSTKDNSVSEPEGSDMPF